MPVSLHLFAASEADVAELVGIGTRDPDVATAVLSRMLEVTEEDHAWDMPGVDVAGRVVLWHPELPYEGTEDAYWRALEALVAVTSLADLGPEGCRVARDLDDAFTAAGVAREAAPLALSRRPRVPLPGAEDFDVRVIEHDAATALLQTWLLAESGTHDDLTAWARFFLSLDGHSRRLGRRPVDLWLFSPGHDLAAPRRDPAPWPPREVVDRGPIGPLLGRLAGLPPTPDTVT